MITDRFDVNLSILFTELDLLERPAAAKAAGFDRVEFWWPFASATPAEAEVEKFVRALDEAGVSLVGLNFFGGDLAAGERGVLSDPDRCGEFAANIDVLCEIGERLGCRAFNALYGNRVDGVDPRHQDEVATESLVRAARGVARIGGTVLVEPISGIPTHPLRTAADGLAVVDRVREAGGVDDIHLLLDLYHLVTNGDEPDVVLDERPESIGHVQIADSPGRGEPGTGSIDFAHYFARLDEVGYTGHIGLEYKPSGASTEAFGWISR
ncbi:hydroxypyruvate isomerase family protein [Saccharopolyspora dendranthemae]|uniref:Hydroxypyruvate isomerase n=1 Tax=Saccharopolyspora dendranthemae TaxID=1181886 RepID=A0A561U101_9PSEU|nr:TIM barrel protein [Saccharopolyspora dendranthemae]TWF93042.1 hydroxypyruvate isomerase [Saccharopolyspora dendranthemae]